MTTTFACNLIEYQAKDTNYRFLICDAPSDANLPAYISLWKRHSVAYLVRTCSRTYDDKHILTEGITVTNLEFPDGRFPSTNILHQWRQIIRNSKGSCIAIHCVAGLGRAPLLVCIALIQAGMDNTKAIELVRSKRPGALNNVQLKYLREYKVRDERGCNIL